MSIFKYPYQAYFNILNEQITELGNYQLASDGELSLANLRVYHKKSGAFDYQMRLILSQEEGKAPIAYSNWEQFNNAAIGQTTADWMGDLTFTFEGYKLKSDFAYAVAIEVTGYTRNSNNSYLGVWLDWWYPVGVSNSAGARIALGVKR